MDKKIIATTNFYDAWKDNRPQTFSTGVSLHGHTWNSHESLAFLPGAVKKTYILPYLMQMLEKRFKSKWRKELDYSLGYWTSPISPDTAYALESRQIEEEGLVPLVSLTDHNEIAACKNIISLEWTAPYKHNAIFHIGIHNLPHHEAERLLTILHGITAEHGRDEQGMQNVLAEIAAFPGALIVLNHPLVDQGQIGHEMHESLVAEFLKDYHPVIHALEINALQPKSVNERVVGIAQKVNLPLIAGGDRHAFEPNGAINLTNATTFGEFAREMREAKTSTILFMPQYRERLAFRYTRNIEMVMGEYPELGARAFWHDRVFYQCPDGITRSLTEMTAGKKSVMVKTTNRIVGAIEIVNYFTTPLPPVFPRAKKSSKKR